MIEVILLERIDGLGTMGQTVKVRPGYARNFLLPQNKALRSTKANAEVFEKQRAVLEARNAAERATAETLATKMEGLKLVVIRQASEMGQLFGSVSSRDIVEAAQASGHTLHRNQVHIDAPIKTIGLFPVKIKLHPEVTAKVTVNVARSPEEAQVQVEKSAVSKKAAAAAEKSEFDAAFFSEPGENVESLVTEETLEVKKPAKKTKKEETAATEDAPKVKKPRAKKAAAE